MQVISHFSKGNAGPPIIQGREEEGGLGTKWSQSPYGIEAAV